MDGQKQYLVAWKGEESHTSWMDAESAHENCMAIVRRFEMDEASGIPASGSAEAMLTYEVAPWLQAMTKDHCPRPGVVSQ